MNSSVSQKAPARSPTKKPTTAAVKRGEIETADPRHRAEEIFALFEGALLIAKVSNDPDRFKRLTSSLFPDKSWAARRCGAGALLHAKPLTEEAEHALQPLAGGVSGFLHHIMDQHGVPRAQAK